MGTENPWAELAKKLHVEVHPGWTPGGPLFQVRVGHTLVTADAVMPGGFAYVTRVRALYLNPDGFRFSVRSAGVGSELGKLLFGMQDIAVGDKHFDRRFVVQGTDEARTRSLFGRPRIRELVAAHGVLDLKARPLRRWSSNHLTGDVAGVDELCFVGGTKPSSEELERLFELYREILEELERAEAAGRDEVDVLTSRLEARGGTISELHITLWDGNRPRRDAAVRLGRLGDTRAVPPLIAALGDEDAELRGAAADALGALGDVRAVAPLSGLLGDRKRSAGTMVSEHATGALRALGAADLVDAFHRALQGDPGALREQVHAYQAWSPVAHALIAVMEGSDLSATEAAGRTLGRLGAREVLPELRRIDRTTGWDRTREACRKTIAELESMASLPRPAEPDEAGRETLPRVAAEPGRDTTTLPRAVTRGGDESTQGGTDD